MILPLKIDRLNHLFIELASIDAPSFQERMAADTVIAFLRNLGLVVEEDLAATLLPGNSGNLLCKIPANWPLSAPEIQDHDRVSAFCQEERLPLLLSTHLDTVAPCRGKKVTLGADGVFRSDGTTILGADDYAGVVATLEAVRLLSEHPMPHRPLELLFSVAEEAHLKGIGQFDAKSLAAREGYVLDTSGPPGTGVMAAPGHNHLIFTITGKAAHAGIAPETGISAITVAAQAIATMQLGRIDAETTANIGEIQGGGATNIVAESCTVTAECRSLDADKLTRQTTQLCQAMTEAAERMGATVDAQIVTSYYPYQVKATDSVARRFIAACEQIGLAPRLTTTGGGSDMNVLSRAGISGMVLSCGMQQVHSNQEFLIAQDLAVLTDLVMAIILSDI
ncbi:MAG: M20/M25/M40 family metallo-hydrolase [Eubacteriales bacterium]|nr:M20/M25/M40 family metallo-hydrolase [Eubacteriales bacterium]